LNAWRKELGLAPVRRIVRWWNSPYGVLCLFPEWYAPPQRDWPAAIMQTDFPLWNRHAHVPLAAEVEAFLSRGTPPLVFTPGSTNLHGGPFFAAAIAACQALGRRAILLTEFPDQLPQPLPDGVAHFSYVPLDALLPRAAAFVHHGGIGSTSQAMLAGIPQVLMPLAHDQFDNGVRVKKLGVGDSIPAPRFTAARLTAALRKLLDSPPVASACREVSRRLAKRDGLARAADAVERRVAGSVDASSR
jgi:UDP:flavonoid glycosyltransferase YjiC (YdhE family)